MPQRGDRLSQTRDVRRGRLFALVAPMALLLLAGCGEKKIAPAFDGTVYLTRLREDPQGEAGAEGYRLAVRAQRAAMALDVYTARFEKQERIDGRLWPLERMEVTIREDPLSVRMRWVGQVDAGKDVLYVEGENDDRARVYTGHRAVKMHLNLDPDGPLAMKGNRHPVTDVGLVTLARGLLHSAGESAPARKESFRYLGRSRLLGREVELVGRRTFPGRHRPHEYMLYALDADRGFPLMAVRYGRDGRLVELYRYRRVNLKAKAPGKVFDFDTVGR